jgi:amidase
VGEAAHLLEGLGHVIEEVDQPTFESGDSKMIPDLAVLMAAALAAREDLPPDETLTSWTRSLIEIGRQATATQVMAAQERVIRACRAVVRQFDHYDLLLSPATAQPPPNVGEFGEITMESVMRLWSLTPFTGLWNTTGQPAASIPWAIDRRGLPLAVQLVGRPGEEMAVLQVSGQIEAEHPWHGWRPPATASGPDSRLAR